MKKLKLKQLALLFFALCLCISTVSVKPAAAKKKVKLNKSKLTLKVGKTYKLKLKNYKKKVKWSSSKKSIATVSSKGKIKAKRKGKATITAKAANKKYKCKLTVKPKTPSTQPSPATTDKNLDFTTPVTPDYQANFTQLKNNILTYGTINSDGNKVLNGTYTYNGMELAYGIIYNTANQSFDFLLVTETELDNDNALSGLSLSISEASIANGSAIYHIVYDSGYYGSAESTIPLSCIQSQENSLNWTVTDANMEDIDGLANLFMNIAYFCWEDILTDYGMGLSLTDLGFGA